jgi:hypothetical protein
MRFDYTHGKGAKYLVSLYGFNVEDKYYCDTYKEAKRIFNSIKMGKHAEGTVVSLTDMQKDYRKMFFKF